MVTGTIGVGPLLAVALPETLEGVTSSAAASPEFCTVTATSIDPPTDTCEGVEAIAITARLAGFCTVAGPAAAGLADTAVPAFASVPLAEVL